MGSKFSDPVDSFSSSGGSLLFSSTRNTFRFYFGWLSLLRSLLVQTAESHSEVISGSLRITNWSKESSVLVDMCFILVKKRIYMYQMLFNSGHSIISSSIIPLSLWQWKTGFNLNKIKSENKNKLFFFFPLNCMCKSLGLALTYVGWSSNWLFCHNLWTVRRSESHQNQETRTLCWLLLEKWLTSQQYYCGSSETCYHIGSFFPHILSLYFLMLLVNMWKHG